MLAIAAGLALAGVVSRRAAEIAILVAIISYAVARSGANIAMRRTYRAERARAEAAGDAFQAGCAPRATQPVSA